MPKWIPELVWPDREVFIIGGGPSLENFNWDILRNKCTIGCNDAYLHGVEISKVCLFSDFRWYDHHRERLAKYKGTVFTSLSYFYASHTGRHPSWVYYLQRYERGIHKNGLGNNFSTGAEAINLAILMGAKTIYLLGFDMHKSEDGRTNYYPNEVDPKQADDVYDRMLECLNAFPGILKSDFPGISVFNITDDSSLNVFPKIGVTEFWKEREKKCVA